MLAADVQSMADADPANAAEIISSAGMDTHAHGVRAKPVLRATMGPGGAVLLYGLAHGDASYDWQHSADEQKSWTSLPSTRTAHTSVRGLEKGKTFWFRFRANTDVEGDFCAGVPFIVH